MQSKKGKANSRLLHAACPEQDCFANARNDKRGIYNDKIGTSLTITKTGCHCEGKARGNLIHFKVIVLSLLLFNIIGCKGDTRLFNLIVRHIENKDFTEEHVVKFKEEFFISDTDYSARVIKFVPDFVMNEKTKRVSSRTRQPNNPAVLIRVYYKGKFLYDSWVLQKADTIHYVRKPGFYFEFKEYSSPLVGERGTHASSMGRVRG